jgi:hypothetical protein
MSCCLPGAHASHFPQNATAAQRPWGVDGWAASRMRVEHAGGAFGRKPFREAGAPRVREGEMSGRDTFRAGARSPSSPRFRLGTRSRSGGFSWLAGSSSSRLGSGQPATTGAAQSCSSPGWPRSRSFRASRTSCSPSVCVRPSTRSRKGLMRWFCPRGRTAWRVRVSLSESRGQVLWAFGFAELGVFRRPHGAPDDQRK